MAVAASLSAVKRASHNASSRSQSYESEAMRNHVEPRQGHGEITQEFPDDDLENVIYPAIREWYGSRRHGNKELERDGDCSPRTAQGILSGEHKPGIRIVMKVMRRNRSILRQWLKAIGEWSDRIAPSDDELAQMRADIEELKRRVGVNP